MTRRAIEPDDTPDDYTTSELTPGPDTTLTDDPPAELPLSRPVGFVLP
jgi:hypothetical protein